MSGPTNGFASLSEPLALVTGASGGIGTELAREAARRGYRLILTARRTDRIEALAAELGAVATLTADLATPGGAAALVEELDRRVLPVDILINNAGFAQHGLVASIPVERQLAEIDVNVRALTELTARLLPPMVARGAGGVLNVASLAGFQPGPNVATYFATKAYVLSFTEALHEENLHTGVHVTALCPGPTRSEFARASGLDATAAFRAQGMVADPVAVARTGLNALEHNRAVAVPGIANQLAVFGNRFAPRSLSRKVAGWLQR